MSQQFKSPVEQANTMMPSSIKGKMVSLKGGGQGYKFEGDKIASAMSDVRGLFTGENYAEVMQMLADKYGATDTNAALVEYLYGQAALHQY